MTNTNEITFEINGATYTRKANGYCYVSYEYSESGKVHRIGKAEFEAKYAQFQTEEAVEVEIIELEPREGEKVYHDEPIERIDIEAAVEATEESQTTEEIKQIAKEFAPKKKSTRKSKDIAYKGHEVTLTSKQVDFIRHLPDTNFWQNGLDSCIWVDCLCDDIGGQFAGKPMTTGAMISTLCEKGLGVRAKERVNKRNCTSFRLTGLGKVIAAELGLN